MCLRLFVCVCRIIFTISAKSSLFSYHLYETQITIYRIQDKPEGEVHELDQTILTALFKSQHLSPPEQLSLGKYLTKNHIKNEFYYLITRIVVQSI